jgi:hypothetical protein
MLDGTGFKSHPVKKIFFAPKTLRLPLGPKQLLIELATGALDLGVKRSGRDATSGDERSDFSNFSS